MKRVILVVISLWCSISLLLSACSASKDATTEKEATIQNPAPLTELQTDSLKNYLDRERLRRKQP